LFRVQYMVYTHHNTPLASTVCLVEVVVGRLVVDFDFE